MAHRSFLPEAVDRYLRTVVARDSIANGGVRVG